MKALFLLICLGLVACIPQPTTRPPEPTPSPKPKVMEFIDILEQVQS